ncbi:MAG: hypothetical protein IPM42_19645 [Saprospiraceae bacterium]|nr:hypothetical protein [Saprospiraceae bacterium]
MFLGFIVILFVVYYLFIKKKEPSLQENEYSFFFNPSDDEITLNQIKVGDSFSLWLKPDSYLIHIYFPGYYFGQGYIGRFNSEKFYRQISSGLYKYEHKVSRIKDRRIYLIFDFIKIDFEAIRLDQLNSVNNFKEKIKKKYTPQKSTTFSFTIIELNKFPKKVVLGHVSIDTLLEQISYGSFNTTMTNGVWLEDELGNLISNTNKTPYDNLLKFFKAVNSGYQPELKMITKVPSKLSMKFLQSVIEWEVIFVK